MYVRLYISVCGTILLCTSDVFILFLFNLLLIVEGANVIDA